MRTLKRIKNGVTAGALALLVLLGGCTPVGGAIRTGQKGGDPYHSLTQVKEPEGIAYDDYEAEIAVREENPVSEAFVGAVKDFSYRTAERILAEGTDSRNYSPLSLYCALALAAQGAEGKTEEEFLALLGVNDGETLARECGNLYRLLYTDNEYGQLKLANSLWLQQENNFRESYLTGAQDDFYASLFQVDFGSPETGKAMGRWISEQTNGTLSPEITTSSREIMAIINTVYFYSEWTGRFDPSANTRGTFITASGGEVACEYMNQIWASRQYYHGDGYAGTSLGLKNSGHMLLILPDEGVSVTELLKQEGKLEEIFERSETIGGQVNLSLPKFRFGDSMELVDMLKDVGLTEAFGDSADFSAMMEGQAFISQVKQETHIGIDENGVEASAYTEVALSGAGLPDGVYELNFNRPFLYGIVSDTGIPLFIGVCNSPE